MCFGHFITFRKYSKENITHGMNLFLNFSLRKIFITSVRIKIEQKLFQLTAHIDKLYKAISLLLLVLLHYYKYYY